MWFLQNMDKFDDFPINKKIKHQSKYSNYLNVLYAYLADFYKKSRPLENFDKIEEGFEATFVEKYKEGRIIGWDQNVEPVDEEKAEYCSNCNKLFISN